MVHALWEEPGSYARLPEDGTEVIYTIRPSDGRFIAEMEHVAGSGSAGRSYEGGVFVPRRRLEALLGEGRSEAVSREGGSATRKRKRCE